MVHWVLNLYNVIHVFYHVEITNTKFFRSVNIRIHYCGDHTTRSILGKWQQSTGSLAKQEPLAWRAEGYQSDDVT